MNEPTITAPREEPVLAVAVQPRPFQFRLWHLLVAMAMISVMLAVLVPLFRMARQRAQRMESANNLKMIAIGLHNYHDTWRSFPPAYQCDANGKPAHSWRMLITPFMEDAYPVYQRYNFAEPWNGPNNSRLAPRCPAFTGVPRSVPDRRSSPATSRSLARTRCGQDRRASISAE